MAIVLILAGLWLLTEVLTFLAILFIAAVVGVFPVIYLAYRRNRQDVQIERLEKEFDLLGLVDSDEKYKVADLYNQVYSPCQFWLYIGLIMILSVAVLVAFGAQMKPELAKVLGGLPNVPATLATPPATSSVVTTTQVVSTTVSLPVTATVSTAVTTTKIVSTTVSTPVTTTEIVTTTEVVTTTVSTPVTTTVSTPVSTTQIVTTTARSEASEAAGGAAAGGAGEPPQTNNLITLMFIGFLGAYVYSIQELVRRYNTFDLQPQVYASILVRMLVAIVLVYVGSSALVAIGGSVAPPAAADLSAGYTAIWAPAIVAFIIGAFPSRGIEWFGHIADRVLGPQTDTASTLPIQNLRGMSTWHASRLEQIGIDDAQNLAHADISKLLLTTPFDPQVVVNWIDQSMLYVKVGPRIANFRDAGIKTFTAFEAALAGKNDSDLTIPAAELLGAGGKPAQLRHLCDSSVFPNYGHIVEYYWRIPTVVQQWAAEGMRELVANLLDFENMEQIEEYIEREKSALSSKTSAERLKLLGNAYVELARRLKDDDTAMEQRKAALECAQQRFDERLKRTEKAPRPGISSVPVFSNSAKSARSKAILPRLTLCTRRRLAQPRMPSQHVATLPWLTSPAPAPMLRRASSIEP